MCDSNMVTLGCMAAEKSFIRDIYNQLSICDSNMVTLGCMATQKLI